MLARGMLLLLLLALVASCRTGGRPQRTIALITPLTTTELWKSVHAGVVRAADENGYRWYWNAPTHENDPERQLDLVDRQLDRDVAGVVLIPAHSSVLIGAVSQAETRGVPLVIAGESLAVPLDGQTGSVSTDNREAGRLAGALAGEVLHGHGDVVVVGINRASTEGLERVASFEQTVHGEGAMRVVLKLDEEVGPGGQSQADLLRLLAGGTARPLVFSASPAATRAVYATLAEGGLLGRVALIGCGQDPELYPALRNGTVRGLIAENAYGIGYRSTAMLVDAQRGRRPLAHVVLPPLLLTERNIDQPETKQYLHPYSGFDR